MSKTFGSKNIGNNGGVSRLEMMKAQIQQKQMEEREEKLLGMMESQQKRAIQKAQLSGTLPPKYTQNSNNTTTTTTINSSFYSATSSKSTTPQGLPPRVSPTNPVAPGKVRQMFEERRKGGTINSTPLILPKNMTGIDKNHPLDPLDHTKSLVNKSRTVSSRSDPAQNNLSRAGATGTKTLPSNRSRSNSKTRSVFPPTPPPLNLGSKSRNLSLDRNTQTGSSSTVLTSPNLISAATSPISSQLILHERRNSGAKKQSPDENGNEVKLKVGPYVPKGTKYKDYATELEERERELENKMKNLGNFANSDTQKLENKIKNSGNLPNNSETHKSRVEIKRTDTQTLLRDRTPSGSGSKTSVAGKSNTAVRTPTNKSPTTGSSSKVRASNKSPVRRSAPPPGLEECHVCHRFFAPDRISKHESICKKTGQKKRKAFDPLKMRMEGTEAEPYIRIVSAKTGKKAPPPPPVKKVDWRKKHEDFIQTIRAAKVYQQHVAAGGNPADLPPPPPSDNSDYIQCPHCKRKFSEGAAHRHIPKCANIKSNKR